MKKLLFVSLLLSYRCFAQVDFSMLAGKYEVTQEELPASISITLDSKGYISLTVAVYEEDSLSCEGQAKILDNDVLTSELDCGEGRVFTQRIDLADVQDFSQFSAPVYSSLYRETYTMDFRKI